MESIVSVLIVCFENGCYYVSINVFNLDFLLFLIGVL